VAATGASPQQAADLLGLPISLCQPPAASDEDDRNDEDDEDDESDTTPPWRQAEQD